jgi:hypothetical protein
MPVHGASDRVDPAYLRARIREDFLPVTSACFESFVARGTDAGAIEGRVIIEFTVVGDEHIGGLVDDVALDDERDGGAPDAGFGDAEFRMCLRESMMAMAFAPPPQGARLRVRYPFRFASGDR